MTIAQVLHSVMHASCEARKYVSCAWWSELITKIDGAFEREQVCKGLDHGDAKKCDAVQAAPQLRATTEYMARCDASRPARQ